MENSVTILIGGEAGQGLLTVGHVLARVLVRSGYHIVAAQDYMSRIRGGHNSFAIRISTDPVSAPREKVDMLIALDGRSVAEHLSSLAPDGIIIMDSGNGAETGGAVCLRVPVADLGKPSLYNFMAAGVAGALLGLEESLMVKALLDEVGDSLEEGAAALIAAGNWALGTGIRHSLPEPAS
ncbi:MAG: 2-oxoacid:acceptor oxidoreductase family protein, partial [Geobacteraceae bacterium]|nr:2-oxoacid:acceptor oxidoreductase family protein [Geobacteraceae bacterium]